MPTVAVFDGYRLRQVEERDYKQLEQWIAADPVHRDVLDPEFFMGEAINQEGNLAEDPHVNVFALDDRKGTLMYIRLSTASRVHIQFAPGPSSAEQGKNFHRELHRFRTQMRNALLKGMAFLEVGLRNTGVREWIFESESQALRSMVEKHMGFVASPHEMVRIIVRGDGQDAPRKTAHTAQQPPQEEA